VTDLTQSEREGMEAAMEAAGYGKNIAVWGDGSSYSPPFKAGWLAAREFYAPNGALREALGRAADALHDCIWIMRDKPERAAGLPAPGPLVLSGAETAEAKARATLAAPYKEE
jgi:hypothetical protein